MFVNFKNVVLLRDSRVLVLIACCLLGLVSIPLHAAPTECASAVPLAPGETWRDPGNEAGEGSCFSVDLDVEGILVLDLSAAADSPRAWLSLVGPATPFQQSATHLVLAASPGSYRLRVDADDPLLPLSPFRLRVRFVAGRFPTGLAKSETDSELEIEPKRKSLVAGPYDRYDLTWVPEPLRPELCGQGETDDHGDGFLCATELAVGSSAAGKIGNGWGDDRDVFRFRLETLTTVELRARGESELTGELFDRHGQRLGVAVGDGDGLRLVRTLVPGTYFVAIEGRGALGRPYFLDLAANR